MQAPFPTLFEIAAVTILPTPLCSDTTIVSGATTTFRLGCIQYTIRPREEDWTDREGQVVLWTLMYSIGFPPVKSTEQIPLKNGVGAGLPLMDMFVIGEIYVDEDGNEAIEPMGSVICLFLTDAAHYRTSCWLGSRGTLDRRSGRQPQNSCWWTRDRPVSHEPGCQNQRRVRPIGR